MPRFDLSEPRGVDGAGEDSYRVAPPVAMNRFPRLSLCALALLLAVLGLSGCETVGLRPGGFTTVVIDAGHGGKDSGESPNQLLKEKDVALDTARRLQPILKNNGLRTVMTRTGDYFVELDDRVAIADKYGPNAILVSIHYDASGGAAYGAHTNFWRPDSYGLAVRVQRHLIGNTGLANRGVVRRVLRLTHNPTVPAILVEGGFLTNHEDAARIRTPEFRQRIAQGIADGILEEQEQGDTNLGSLPPINRPVVTRPAYTHHTGASHREKMSRVRAHNQAHLTHRKSAPAKASKASAKSRSKTKTTAKAKRKLSRKRMIKSDAIFAPPALSDLSAL